MGDADGATAVNSVPCNELESARRPRRLGDVSIGDTQRRHARTEKKAPRAGARGAFH